jgi:hypothetical protein
MLAYWKNRGTESNNCIAAQDFDHECSQSVRWISHNAAHGHSCWQSSLHTLPAPPSAMPAQLLSCSPSSTSDAVRLLTLGMCALGSTNRCTAAAGRMSGSATTNSSWRAPGGRTLHGSCQCCNYQAYHPLCLPIGRRPARLASRDWDSHSPT